MEALSLLQNLTSLSVFQTYKNPKSRVTCLPYLLGIAPFGRISTGRKHT